MLYKKPYFILLVLFCGFASIGFPQEKQELLKYSSETSELFFAGKPLPTWLSLVFNPSNNEQQYNYIAPFSMTFPVQGWKGIDIKIDIKTTRRADTFTPNEKQLSEGWFYSNKTPNNIPEDWLYSPSYALYFNTQGIQKLSRFFINYLGEIPFLLPSVTRDIKQNQFFKIIIPPDDNIATVDFLLPENIALAYKTTLPYGSGQRVFVFYMFEAAYTDKQIELITGKTTYKNGDTLNFLYKIRYMAASQNPLNIKPNSGPN